MGIVVLVLSDGDFGVKLGYKTSGLETGIHWPTPLRNRHWTRLLCPWRVNTAGIRQTRPTYRLRYAKVRNGHGARGSLQVRICRVQGRIDAPRVFSHFTGEVVVHVVPDWCRRYSLMVTSAVNLILLGILLHLVPRLLMLLMQSLLQTSRSDSIRIDIVLHFSCISTGRAGRAFLRPINYCIVVRHFRHWRKTRP